MFCMVYLLSLRPAISAQALLSCSVLVFLHVLVFLYYSLIEQILTPRLGLFALLEGHVRYFNPLTPSGVTWVQL